MNDELDMLAAEYVLGTLGQDERAAFELRLATETEAKRAVEGWNRRLSPLALSMKGIEPPAGFWSKIEPLLEPRDGRHAVATAMPANNIVELQRSVKRWRNAFIAVSALAASLAAYALFQGFANVKPQGAAYVAILSQGGESPALIVNVDAASQSAFVIPAGAKTPKGRSLELWFIGRGEEPKSMGLLESHAGRLSLPAGANVENASFAVSVEPEGGSPTGAPTGPVIYSGKLVRS